MNLFMIDLNFSKIFIHHITESICAYTYCDHKILLWKRESFPKCIYDNRCNWICNTNHIETQTFDHLLFGTKQNYAFGPTLLYELRRESFDFSHTQISLIDRAGNLNFESAYVKSPDSNSFKWIGAHCTRRCTHESLNFRSFVHVEENS